MHVVTEQLYSVVIKRSEATAAFTQLAAILSAHDVEVGEYPMIDTLCNVLEAISDIETEVMFTAEVEQPQEALPDEPDS
jgi:hypothetical protein